ncbi:MAG: hypothetical protein B7X77_03960, partial [Caulobacter sp. 39-67-4]
MHQPKQEGAIRFLLDGQVHEVRGADPTRTLLEHLRGDLRRTGTKEGCAEGDCGSCTVLVGEPDGEGVAWRAVNSCIQFLPMLHGKALMTVESLSKDGALHPVQQAMVDRHGSQCGFCTPGIVMSLYAKAVAAKGADASPAEMLAGNLCRCTGYGPIIDVANGVQAEAPPAVDLSWVREEAMLDLTYEDPVHGVTRRWLAPRSVEDLASAFIEHPDATIVAGATDVGLWITKQRRPLKTLIDIGQVAELKRIETVEGGVWKASHLVDRDGQGRGQDSDGEGLLITETVVPGFEYADHEFLSQEKFEQILPEDRVKELG